MVGFFCKYAPYDMAVMYNHEQPLIPDKDMHISFINWIWVWMANTNILNTFHTYQL